MCNFIEDYLENPALAISNAVQRAAAEASAMNFDEDLISSELSSPEFRLYEEMIFCSIPEDYVSESVRSMA